MRINQLKKMPISALVLAMNNPLYDDEFRTSSEIELKDRVRNLGYDYNDLVNSEVGIIMRRGTDINNYLIGSSPNMQLLFQLYFQLHNNPSEENPLLFSERHLCNDINDKKSFFSLICAKEVANMEKRMMEDECDEAIITAYNLLLERGLDLNIGALQATIADTFFFWQRAYGYANNKEAEMNECINPSLMLRAKSAILESINSGMMQSDFAKRIYANYFIHHDSKLLARQKSMLYSQVKSGYMVDYTTEEMIRVLKLDK